MYLLKDVQIQRVGRNIGMLLGGNSAAGLLALAAVAIAARGLGAEAFGLLMVVHAYAMLVGGLCRFNVYHALVRYGATCVQDLRRHDLQGLLVFGLLIELAGMAAAGALGVATLGWLGPFLGLPEAAHDMARWYCLFVILANTATPIGILRLLDRFDLVAWIRPIAPALRLLGCLVAWAMGAGLAVFATVWALAAVVEALILWYAAGRVLHQGGWLEAFAWRIRGLVRPHPGLWRMVIWTNLQGSLGLVSGRLATVLVGVLLGPAAAGLYLVAYQAAALIERPLLLVKRVVDPEFARLAASHDRASLVSLYRRSLVLSLVVALPLLALFAAFGDRLLVLYVGEAFAAAHGVLILLALKTALLVLMMPSAGLLVMLGEAGWLFAVQLLGRSLQLLGLVLLVPTLGLLGAGIAAALTALVELVLAKAVVLIRFHRATAPAPPETDTPLPAR